MADTKESIKLFGELFALQDKYKVRVTLEPVELSEAAFIRGFITSEGIAKIKKFDLDVTTIYLTQDNIIAKIEDSIIEYKKEIEV